MLHTKIMYCIVYIRACVERNYPATSSTEMWEEGIILHPRMGGHCVVPRNGTAYLGAKVVENGPAWRVLDDELEQLHRRIGQASSGFDEEDSEVIRVSDLKPCLTMGKPEVKLTLLGEFSALTCVFVCVCVFVCLCVCLSAFF